MNTLICLPQTKGKVHVHGDNEIKTSESSHANITPYLTDNDQSCGIFHRSQIAVKLKGRYLQIFNLPYAPLF